MPPSADTTSNLLKGLKIVQSLSEAVPHGGILKAVAGVGITILETVERARVNREECFDIARRAAEHISVLKRLRTEDGLSDDLGDSLERYRRVLEEVSTRVEGLGSMSGAGKKWMFQTTSVQEETQMCLEKLDEAYQMYIFDFSIATDKKLTTLVNGMRAISLRLDSPTSQVHRRDEPDEIRRISMEDIQFAEEIRCIKTRSYRLRIQPGKVIDRFGAHKNVVIRKFESGVEREDERWGAFNEEIEWRRDLLGVHFARMLGIAIPSRRTKIIVVEAGSISAYDHLQSLSGLEFLLEHVRIMFDFVTAYQFLADHGSSWRGGYRDIVLNGRDNRLFLGALGRIDNQWKNSGKRMWDAFFNLAVGHDLTWRGGDSFDVSADFFRRATESLKKWQEAQNEECARELWACLWLWRGSSQFEEGVVDSPPLGEIGWREGGIWRAIPLVHRFPVACAAEYSITAYRCRDEENEAIVGTQTKGYTRWSFHVSPGEEIELQTCVQSCCTDQVSEFFCASALPLAHRYGVDVRLLRLGQSSLSFFLMPFIELR
ncbi:hypothetical protein SISSUDRAFT_424736 [Sistotremastrum suecicum HHB10207 ss-3]|uniref:Uncharacterized protein n=1 Tax=Sistotremastrum suecicum HHB10207 ss-3 TaxID=1314776 RepID=A0A165YIB7_9AGAM|nr:hypothetical protein SISSUDRAFT_424736 [Sistotremastrum suecicum HHB10207 ss-3]